MPIRLSLDELRREYTRAKLHEDDVLRDPFAQFEKWFNEALSSSVAFPDAMTLATVSPEGTPDARVVLLKALDEGGLIFFTNYESPTGRQLDTRPHASCVLWWPELERQVRVRGHVERVPEEMSDHYFKKRPRGAQLAAWCSAQSEIIAAREILEQNLEEVEEQFRGMDVPRPRHWGGYRLVPHVFEFWQGRINRLHDRLRFRRDDKGIWIIERLAP